MAFQARLSQVKSFFSPSQGNTTTRRLQPKRYARKKQDENFVYPDQDSIICGSTLSESQMILPSDNRKNCVLDTQPIEEGTDSIIVTSQSQTQTVVPETQQSMLSSADSTMKTPPSRHGNSMRCSLSQTMFNDEQPSQSLLSMRDLSHFQAGNALHLSSTPLGRTDMPIETATSETMTDPVCADDKNVQTSGPSVSDKLSQTSSPTATEKDVRTSGPDFRDVALFRYNGNLSVLSNFYAVQLIYRGITYKSAEHAYQHRMALFNSCPDAARRIIFAKNAPLAKAAAKHVLKSEKWHETKASVMAEILLCKAEQCPKFKDALLKTGHKSLIHNIDTDTFWGCGPDLMGKNVMGVLLEELRQSIRDKPNKQQPPPPATPDTPPHTVSDPIPDCRPRTMTDPILNRTDKTRTALPTSTKPKTPRGNSSSDVQRTPEPPSVLVLGNSLNWDRYLIFN